MYKKTLNFQYQSPKAELIETQTQLICQSSSIQGLVEEDPGFVWE